ncbi:unnamed protein product [Lactuca virosa]|uniref:RING-type E3 ubiquitin transferase n=1 Tax=Lactuca virosa TaxID=75947 RepID=A0AAU9NXS4_9ASTR|nr:unnamed protein product [Lactuca virosa]
MFFSKIMKEASDIMGCISSRVRHLVQLHCNTVEGQMLIKYVIMNAIALRKILKKYDKVHNSVSGMNFRSKLQDEHLEILQSPWLIELVAFYMNFSESNEMICYELCSSFSYDLSVIISEPVLKLVLPDYVKGFSHVNINTWLVVLPHIIATIHSNNHAVRELIQSLLVRIGQSHPHALMYPLLVACKSISNLRKVATQEVVDKVRKHSGLLVDQVLEPLHEILEEGAKRNNTTIKEKAFIQSVSPELVECRDLELTVPGTYWADTLLQIQKEDGTGKEYPLGAALEPTKNTLIQDNIKLLLFFLSRVGIDIKAKRHDDWLDT